MTKERSVSETGPYRVVRTGRSWDIVGADGKAIDSFMNETFATCGCKTANTAYHAGKAAGEEEARKEVEEIWCHCGNDYIPTAIARWIRKKQEALSRSGGRG